MNMVAANCAIGRVLAACIVMVLSLAAGAAAQAAAPDPLFATEDVLSITLTGPLRDMSRDRDDDPEYRPGKLSYVDPDGELREFDIRIRPRGKSRRDRKVCKFPPLRVNFKKSEVGNSVFANQNALKLVTHCRSGDRFQRYVLKEYLAYRIFNELSDVSFRVRLLEITYHDSERDDDALTSYGFFIEHKKRLAARLGTKVAEPTRIDPKQLEPVQASIGELFQYLVSNTDYSFIAAAPGETCCHNAILLEAPGGLYYPVPYDFDRTGIVDPPTALPDEHLGQKSVRDRLYRGFCRHEPYFADALEHARSKRDRIEALFANQTGLTDDDRRKAAKFIASFYDVVNDPGRHGRALKCRGSL